MYALPPLVVKAVITGGKLGPIYEIAVRTCVRTFVLLEGTSAGVRCAELVVDEKVCVRWLSSRAFKLRKDINIGREFSRLRSGSIVRLSGRAYQRI